MSAKGYFADSGIEFINRTVLLCQNTPQCKSTYKLQTYKGNRNF